MTDRVCLTGRLRVEGCFVYLPVTQRKRKPSSCKAGMLSFLISSSVSVPYGSSMWMSQGGSAITTENFPRMDMSRKRMSQQIH